MTNYDAITQGLTTKSDKIRALARHGVSTADIARHIGIRYQHARNVLVDAGLHFVGQDESRGGFREAAPPELLSATLAGKTVSTANRDSVWADFAADGSVKIPAELLKRAGFEPGDRVLIGLTEDGLELLSRAASLRQVQAMFKGTVPKGVSVVDEFIEERRREAKEADARLNNVYAEWRGKK